MQSEIYQSHARHYVAVDCSIFGYEDGELKLLLYPRAFEPEMGKWSLMGGFVEEQESLEDAARRVLLQTTGLHNLFLELASAFSKPDRDSGARVISVTFMALVRIDLHDKELVKESGAQWWSVKELPELIFDHQEMVRNSLTLLQQKALLVPVGKELLPDQFTLKELRNLYDAIFQRVFDPGNFRKKVLSLNIVERLDEKDKATSRKGAYYYRFNVSNLGRQMEGLFNLFILVALNCDNVLATI